MENQFDVYLDYSRCDKQFVRELVQKMDSAGIRYWVDHNDIHSGDYFTTAIADAITKTVDKAKVFLTVISKNRGTSLCNGLKYAIDSGAKFIIPVYLDMEPSEVPETFQFLLRKYNEIYFRTGENLTKITDVIFALLGRDTWVFLSHSNKDFDKVTSLRNKLEYRNYRPLLFFLKCLDKDEEIFELIKREIYVRDRFILCNSQNTSESKWVQKEVEYIKSLNRPYEVINIEGAEDEINAAIDRFDRRSNIYIWSTESVFNQTLARDLIQKSFRVSLLPMDFYQNYTETTKFTNGYSIILISRKLSEQEANAIELYSKRICDYVYPIVISEEGLANWELFRDMQNYDGIRTNVYLLDSNTDNEAIQTFPSDVERIDAIVSQFIKLDNYKHDRSQQE